MRNADRRKRYHDIFFFLIAYLVLFSLAFFSKEISQGIKNGIAVCMNTLIPSLFIFMIASQMIMHTKIKELLALPFRGVAKRWFHIAPQHFSIVILSLIGGYPVGAKLLCDCVKQNQMSAKTASRMLCYCMNCGPAFLISAIGIQLFHNHKIGVMLYLSQIIACFCVGFIMGRMKDKEAEIQNVPTEKRENSSVVLVNAVNDTVRSMGIVCGFVVAFSGVFPIMASMLKQAPSQIAVIVQGLLEVVAGSNNPMVLQASEPILLVACFTAFGGICVHLQLCAMLKGSQIKMKAFFLTRILYTFISIGVMKLALILSPETLACFSMQQHPVKLYSVSPVATLFLILLSVMLLFFRTKSDKIKIN